MMIKFNFKSPMHQERPLNARLSHANIQPSAANQTNTSMNSLLERFPEKSGKITPTPTLPNHQKIQESERLIQRKEVYPIERSTLTLPKGNDRLFINPREMKIQRPKPGLYIEKTNHQDPVHLRQIKIQKQNMYFNDASWFSNRNGNIVSQKALNILQCYKKDKNYIQSIPDEEFEEKYQIVEEGYYHAEEERLPFSLEFKNLLSEFAREYVRVRIQRLNNKDRQDWQLNFFDKSEFRSLCNCFWRILSIISPCFHRNASSN